VYQFLVKRHLRKQFDRLSVGDYESVLAAIPAGGPRPVQDPTPSSTNNIHA
jgi:hypothetical protein